MDCLLTISIGINVLLVALLFQGRDKNILHIQMHDRLRTILADLAERKKISVIKVISRALALYDFIDKEVEIGELRIFTVDKYHIPVQEIVIE